jgi:glutamyl-tRNA reductase
MSELAALDLASGGVEIVVANRTLARAEELARRLGGLAVGFDQLAEELGRADVVISSTRCPRLVLSAEEVAGAIRHRRSRQVLFIDIAVPRDLDPATISVRPWLRAVPTGVGKSCERRRLSPGSCEVPGWRLSLGVVPAITSWRRHAKDIRRAELARAEGCLAALWPSQRHAVEALTAQIMNKLLHQPTMRMKQAALLPEGHAYASVVERLFRIGENGR